MISLKHFLDETRSLAEIDMAFADMIARRANLDDNLKDSLYVLAAETLYAFRQSHSCLDIEARCEDMLKEALNSLQARQGTDIDCEDTPTPDTLKAWIDAWKDSLQNLKSNALKILGKDGAMPPDSTEPLLLWNAPDGRTRAYLNRCCTYENTVAADIVSRLNCNAPAYRHQDDDALKQAIHRSNSNFSQLQFEECRQQQAVFHTLKSPFSIITGGPGTGKTTVLSVILAQLLTQNPSLDISLCAPTGKAAARMKEAIENAVKNTLTETVSDEIKQKMLELKTQTVHRLVGISYDTDYPRCNSENVIDSDVVAVDECSMMSLQLFSQLISAIRKDARIILLGDENQLASVDAGNVLAELCHSTLLTNRPEECQVINRLTRNYRSNANPALCDYAAELVAETTDKNAMEPNVTRLYEGSNTRFSALETTGQAHGNARDIQLKNAVRDFLASAGLEGKPSFRTYQEAAVFLKKIKILCALHEGRYGVKNLNHIVRELLGLNAEYANGVPVMITQNDPVTGLNNGDVGICFNGKAYFSESDDTTAGAQTFEFAQLPPHEIAFAMTIHKSQGSDYAHVFMVLPERDNPVLCRELVYTGITRTKSRFTLLAPRAVLENAQLRRTVRWTGLGIRLALSQGASPVADR